MILPRTEDAPHKYQMYRLLAAILEEPKLSQHLAFKGGTCAVLRGWLDRFSIDLDFDLPAGKAGLMEKGLVKPMRATIHTMVKRLGFEIKDESHDHLQFFLKYDAPAMRRNTLKLEIHDEASPANTYEIGNLAELNLLARTHTRGTMVANKLVAAMNRYQDHQTIAGRDFYDLHYFLSRGFEVNEPVVEERTGMRFGEYIDKLIGFVESKVTEKDLYEDMNPLLPAAVMKTSVPSLKKELLVLLRGL